MTDIIPTRGGDHLIVRRIGRAGRITMNNPKALNALTYEMSLGLEDAMDAWRNDDAVDLIRARHGFGSVVRGRAIGLLKTVPTSARGSHLKGFRLSTPSCSK